MVPQLRHLLTCLGIMAAKPWAFVVVAVYGLAWFVLDRETLDWHSIATMATWLMTLVIQRAEHRDTQAVQAKLDELIHAQKGAHNHLTRLDEKEPEDIEKHREKARRVD